MNNSALTAYAFQFLEAINICPVLLVIYAVTVVQVAGRKLSSFIDILTNCFPFNLKLVDGNSLIQNEHRGAFYTQTIPN